MLKVNYKDKIMVTKKQYDAKFKAKLALELIREKKSVIEIGTEYKVPQANLHVWKNKLIESAVEIFLPEAEKNKILRLKEQEVSLLHKIIGEITVENNFFKKKLKL
jgi:transposase-like protein